MQRTWIVAITAVVVVGLSGREANAGAPFEAEVVGIEVDGQVVAGIPGGAPWVVDEGQVRIDDDGELTLDVEGLLLLNGTVGPVFEVAAGVFCSTVDTDEEEFTEVARTGNAPLNADGDAEIEETLELPGVCAAAIVLARVTVIDAGFVGGPPGGP